jgi:agmatinase
MPLKGVNAMADEDGRKGWTWMEGQVLVLDPTVEVSLFQAGHLLVRGGFCPRGVCVSPDEWALLRRFQHGAAPRDVASGGGPLRDLDHPVLARCVRSGILLPRAPDGMLLLPDCVLPARTLCDVPAWEDAEEPAVVFLGVPHDGGASGLPGARAGPSALRLASDRCRTTVDVHTGLPAGFYDWGQDVPLLRGVSLADAGDVLVNPGDAPGAVHARVRDVVTRIARAPAIPAVLGGDHSVSHAVLGALAPRPLTVLHLDAHPDLGSIHAGDALHHGSFLSHVLRDGLHVQRVVQVGMRGVRDGDPREPHPRVTALGMDRFRTLGPNAVPWVLSRVPAGDAVYITVDIDVVDPSWAPWTGTPVPGGMAPHEVKALLRAVGEARNVVGLDVMEVGSAGGRADETALVALECLLTALDAATTRRPRGCPG